MPLIRTLSLLARIAFCGAFLMGSAYSLVLAPPTLAIGGDILLHCLGYAVLTMFGMVGWPHRPNIVFLTVSALGFILELLQALHPVRAFEGSDLAANIAGSGLALLLMHITQHTLNILQQKSP